MKEADPEPTRGFHVFILKEILSGVNGKFCLLFRSSARQDWPDPVRHIGACTDKISGGDQDFAYEQYSVWLLNHKSSQPYYASQNVVRAIDYPNSDLESDPSPPVGFLGAFFKIRPRFHSIRSSSTPGLPRTTSCRFAKQSGPSREFRRDLYGNHGLSTTSLLPPQSFPTPHLSGSLCGRPSDFPESNPSSQAELNSFWH